VRRVVRQNLFWSLAYNSVAVGLAAAARLDPLVAALAMIGSSLLVLGNSRRLERGGTQESPPSWRGAGGTEIAKPEDVGAPVGAFP
jgi:Cu2+-exporting ATPase